MRTSSRAFWSLTRAAATACGESGMCEGNHGRTPGMPGQCHTATELTGWARWVCTCARAEVKLNGEVLIAAAAKQKHLQYFFF